MSIVLLWVAGSVFKLVEWTKPVGAPISVALVQGNIAQDEKFREILFLREPSEQLATWEGPKLTREQAQAQTGIRRVEWLGQFQAILHRLICECDHVYLNTNEHKRAAVEVTAALLSQAMQDDRLAHLAALALQTCRQQRIIAPSPLAVERLCGELRHQARREVYRRLTGGLSAEQRRRLDALTGLRGDTSQVWLTWLRQTPQAASPSAMLGLIERLEHVRAIGIAPSRGHLIHQARLSQLAREADKTTVQHVARFERQRRHATLVAITLDFATSLTDQAIELFDRLIGGDRRRSDQQRSRNRSAVR